MIFPKSEKNKGKGCPNTIPELSAPGLDMSTDFTEELVGYTLHYHTQKRAKHHRIYLVLVQTRNI